MNVDILKRYKKMQSRFDLPHLSELRQTFNFDLDESDDILEKIRLEMSEKLFTFTEKIIEPLIFTTEETYNFEQNMLTQTEMDELFSLYKKLQVLKWNNNLLTVKPDEKETVIWINKTWKLWNDEVGKKMTQLCSKFSKEWEKMQFKSEKTNYHS